MIDLIKKQIKPYLKQQKLYIDRNYNQKITYKN